MDLTTTIALCIISAFVTGIITWIFSRRGYHKEPCRAVEAVGLRLDGFEADLLDVNDKVNTASKAIKDNETAISDLDKRLSVSDERYNNIVQLLKRIESKIDDHHSPNN